MKLALDPQIFATHRVWELPDVVASLGTHVGDYVAASPTT